MYVFLYNCMLCKHSLVYLCKLAGTMSVVAMQFSKLRIPVTMKLL